MGKIEQTVEAQLANDNDTFKFKERGYKDTIADEIAESRSEMLADIRKMKTPVKKSKLRMFFERIFYTLG